MPLGYVPGRSYFKEVIVGTTPVTVTVPDGARACALGIGVGSEDHPATSTVFLSYNGIDPAVPAAGEPAAFDFITKNQWGDRYFGISEVRLVSAEEGQYVRLLFTI